MNINHHRRMEHLPVELRLRQEPLSLKMAQAVDIAMLLHGPLWDNSEAEQTTGHPQGYWRTNSYGFNFLYLWHALWKKLTKIHFLKFNGTVQDLGSNCCSLVFFILTTFTMKKIIWTKCKWGSNSHSVTYSMLNLFYPHSKRPVIHLKCFRQTLPKNVHNTL